MIADEVLKMDGFGNFYGLKATDLADAGNTTPAEFLFRTYFNSRDLENKHFAPYYLGKANTVPSQNLVDAFPMKRPVILSLILKIQLMIRKIRMMGETIVSI